MGFYILHGPAFDDSMKDKIKSFLKENPGLWDVENIRKSCSIGHWSVALSKCLELLQSGDIQGVKSSRGWIFWIEKENI